MEGPSSLTEGNASLIATIFNGLNSIIGNGVLLVPCALASTGWFSLVLLSIVAILATYSGTLIKRCMTYNPRIKSYPDIGDHVFGHLGKVFMSIILFGDLYLVDVGYLILEGDNLQKLFPTVAMELLGMHIKGKSMFVIIFSLVVLPTVWLGSLGILAYISISGVFASIIILGSVLWVGVSYVGFHHTGKILNWKGIPTTVSLFMVSCGSHPVFPALYTSMKTKEHFSSALLLCFFIASTIYASMAIIGYLMFGQEVGSQITLNLLTNKISSKIAIYAALITPLAKYALMLKPVIVSVESWFPTKYRVRWYFKIVVRTALVATQVAIALALPFFGDLMALMGSLLAATSSLTMPCLCYLQLSRNNSHNKSIIEKIFIWGIIIISAFIITFGTYTSFVNLIEELSK